MLDDIVREWETLQDPASRAIVYCRSHNDAKRVGQQLKCGVYHSGLKSSAAKKEAFSNWVNGGLGISKFISATSGLGAGIDIPSVRIVYHYRESLDFLGFVQESGRAGRDGLPAKSKVFLDTTSLKRLENLEGVRTSLGQQAIFEYHIKGFCRQAAISFYVDGMSTWCVNSTDSDLIHCDLCQILRSQAKSVAQPSLSDSPSGIPHQ
ncbi:P-loop containing nucleoside triphosphate hydrolase protein [Tuber borchii]|uniref:DNA 3'-5' helicase n=1 Tax=Tuber borchii TaxID=42251 RepID=A0A2T6ZHH5_TUBBO|nr:P-loop containing nucleoside triphosphate hydrolase protein [Tuber borchii]